MAQDAKQRPGMSWEQMEKAALAADREDYRNSTPGQRIENVIRLSRFAGELFVAGERRRARGE